MVMAGRVSGRRVGDGPRFGGPRFGGPLWAGVAPDYARCRGHGRPTPEPPRTPQDVPPGSALAAPQQPPDGTLKRGQWPQRGAVPVDEALLETDVLAVSELGVRLQCWRVVGPDVEPVSYTHLRAHET